MDGWRKNIDIVENILKDFEQEKGGRSPMKLFHVNKSYHPNCRVAKDIAPLTIAGVWTWLVLRRLAVEKETTPRAFSVLLP